MNAMRFEELPLQCGLFDWIEWEKGRPPSDRLNFECQVDESGINYVCAIFAFGDLRHSQVMASMRLFVEDVMPALRRQEG